MRFPCIDVGLCPNPSNAKMKPFRRTEINQPQRIGIIICDRYRSCSGGNAYAGEEVVKNGVTVIHLATRLLVGYPPFPSIDQFVRFTKSATRSASSSAPIQFLPSITRSTSGSGHGRRPSGNTGSTRPPR